MAWQFKPGPPSWLLWAVVLAAIWGPIVYVLGAQWSVYEQYRFGWAVPVMCLYLAWSRVQVAPPAAPPVRKGFVFVLLAGSGLLLLIARVLQEANPLWRVASYALVTSAAVLTLGLLYLTGGKVRTIHFSFPVLFFLVAVPWPTPLEMLTIQNLTRLNAGAVVELLNLSGIPAVLHGNVIEVSTGMVGIDEACSGIRSVQATLMITLFFGELYRLTMRRRLGLVFIGLALAVFFNLVRTLSLSWVASREGIEAIQNWHDPAGVA